MPANDNNTIIELPCKLFWGTDPRIELSGTAVEIAADAIVIELAETDRRLWPEPGKNVVVEVTWSPVPPVAAAAAKTLTCRGSVARLTQAPDGSVKLACAVRRGRFADAKRTNLALRKRAAGDWTM